MRFLLRRLLAYTADCTLLFIVLAPSGFAVQHGLAVSPDTALAVYITLLLNFSIPSWTYFIWGDHSNRGATLGKRLLTLQAKTVENERIGMGRALGRTAMKMLPWEITHASAFLLAPALGTFGATSWIGLGLAYVLIFAYLGVAWRTGGRRSVHDFAATTFVGWAASRTDVQADNTHCT